MEIEPELPTYPQSASALSKPATLKVLVVEDNLTNQKVIVRQLQSLGYVAEVASDGQAALDALAATAYPIVLMDCRLPEVDGFAATRLIRQREQQLGEVNPTIIIALTASDDPQVHREAKAAGMNDFLTKPLRRDTLALTLKHWSQFLGKQFGSVELQNFPAAVIADSVSPTLSQKLWELHFDLNRLHQLSDNSREFEQELLQIYVDDTQDQLQHLQQAISKQNLQHIERIAHHIKGASASVGAKQMKQFAEATEQQAKQQQLDTLDMLMLQMRQAFSQIQMLLDV